METKDILNCKLTILMNDKDRKRFDIACTENNTTMAEEVRAFIKGRIAELNKAAGKNKNRLEFYENPRPAGVYETLVLIIPIKGRIWKRH